MLLRMHSWHVNGGRCCVQAGKQCLVTAVAMRKGCFAEISMAAPPTCSSGMGMACVCLALPSHSVPTALPLLLKFRIPLSSVPVLYLYYRKRHLHLAAFVVACLGCGDVARMELACKASSACIAAQVVALLVASSHWLSSSSCLHALSKCTCSHDVLLEQSCLQLYSCYVRHEPGAY